MNRNANHGFRGLATAVVLVAVASLAASAPARGDLVGFWKFNEGTGTTAADSSGFANTGTLVAGATWANDPQRGQVLSTGYPSQRVEVPFGTTSSLANLGTTAFTFSMWVKETSNSNYGHILVLSNNQSNRNWLWQSENSSGGDSSYVWSTTDNRWQKGLGWTIPNNQWYQYTFSYSGGTLLSYRDGVQNGSYSVANAAPLPQMTSGTWNIGGWNALNSSFIGNLSDVSFWSTGLSQGKTASLYNITTVNSGALADYDALRMKTLFRAYDLDLPQVVTSTAGPLEWEKFTGLAGTSGAATFDAGTQTYRVWFDSTSGVVAVPEPAGLAGLGGGLLLLLAAGRRGFRRPAAR